MTKKSSKVEMFYTLVQHTGWTVGQKPAFKNAVEMRMINRQQAEKVQAKGGHVFRSYADAHDAEHKANFPDPNYQGIYPSAQGRFVKVGLMEGEPVFVAALWSQRLYIKDNKTVNKPIADET